MKGKTPKLVMVVMALAMVVSLVAGVATAVGAEKPGVDERWTGFTLPSEVGYQVFPGTEVGQIELCDDGTLLAAVYDETFNRWGSPRGTVWAAVFYSTDGGYYWHFGWELPEDDPGPVVDLVAAPDYEHPGTAYLATQTYLYWTEDGCETFYRTYTACPGVSGDPDDGILGGVITSLDVAIDAVEAEEYVAVVGTNWGGLDGVYCWNIQGVPQWQDMEITNRISAAFDTGREGVLEVAFSPNYPDDRVIYAIANYDPCIISPPWDLTAPSDFTTVVTIYDGMSGTWGIQYMDAAIWTLYVASQGVAIGAPGSWARIAFFDDFDIESSPYAVLILSGCPTVTVTAGMFAGTYGPADDVYRTKHVAPAVGPSSATALDLVTGTATQAGAQVPPVYYSIQAYGMVSLTGTILVGAEYPQGSGQAQVFVGTSPMVFPNWEPAMKPPTGGPGLWWNAVGTWCINAACTNPIADPTTNTWAWMPVLGLQLSPGGVDVATNGSDHYVGTNENPGLSASGVSVGRINAGGKWIWNGVGLIDTIVVTTDVLGWTNWAAVTWQEVSPHWAVGSEGDDTLYITTWSAGWDDVFGWGTFDNSAGNDTIKGYWMIAENSLGEVKGRIWGWYDDGTCFALIDGVIEGEVTESWEGTVKVCVGDPVGSCCICDWSAIKGSEAPVNPVAGTFGFDIYCPTGCDSCAVDCDPEVSLVMAGAMYSHDYGIDFWRNAPTGQEQSPEQAVVWELIGYEGLVFPKAPTAPWYVVTGMPPQVSDEWFDFEDAETWAGFFDQDYASLVGFDRVAVPKVAPDFEFDSNMDADEYVFMLAGVNIWMPNPMGPGVLNTGYQDLLYFSFDGGESMWYSEIMPAGAFRQGVTTPPPSGPGMSDAGWTVVDDSTLIMGDIQGYIYKTENRGNSWTDGVDTATGLVTDLNVSPVYAETAQGEEQPEGTDQAVVVGLYNQAATAGQVWLSQDGAEEQFVQVGKDIVDDNYGMESKVVTNFDLNWADNDFIYAGVSGFMARYCCTCPSPQPVDEVGQAGVYRSEVNRGNPADSIWEQIYDYWDVEPLLPNPVDCAWQYWFFTDLDYTAVIDVDEDELDPTVYVPFGVIQYTGMSSADFDQLPDPANYPFRMNFALGGVLRTLDGTKERVEWVGWDELMLGLPRQPYAGLWTVSAVEGTNYLFSVSSQVDVIDSNWVYDPVLEGDLADYDHGLVIYEDTLVEVGPELLSPSDGKKGAGTPAGELEKINIKLDWEPVESEATVTYEVQVDQDRAFNASEAFAPEGTEATALGLVKRAVTTNTFAQFAGLEKEFTYYWRVRVVDPALSPWSDVYEFKTQSTALTSVGTGPNLADGSPASGATDVSTTPTFSWGTLSGAEYYELEVATDSSFSDVVISAETEGTAYQPDEELDENTTYYWRVRGCSDDECSDWSSTGVFTTGPEKGPGTPAWVWVVIVIGAILAIAVVILIVRTRRPA